VISPRVLIVSHTYTARANRAKLDALAQAVELTAIVPDRWQDTLFTIDANAPQSTSFNLYALPIRFNSHILRYWFPMRKLASIVRIAQPDLIYVEEEPASLALAQLAWLKGRAKLVCFAWENIARRIGLPGIEYFNLARCDGVIAGNAQAAEIIRAKGFTKSMTTIPQLGVSLEESSAPPPNDLFGVSGFVVGYAGRLVEEKGLWTLLSAINELPTVQLLLIGSGPLSTPIEEYVAAHNLGERVRILPAVPHNQVAQYLRWMDVFVLASQTTPQWKEQFGHVLIEAMACGTPVIGSDSGAIPKVIGDAGLIFHECDAIALRDAISNLQTNPARRAELAELGRTRVTQHFTHERIATATVEFFQQVLSQ
jgi:glycosyltransferase involved in cell wall biosynthesis